jgi:hypothetical protein
MMQARDRWTFLTLWLLLGGVAALACSLPWPAAHLGDEYLPVGNDSFYHARRILDTARDPSSFYQFDVNIHAPEGSLLVWPWGYDYIIAALVRLGMHAGLATDPMAILIWTPVAAVFASLFLVLLISRRLSFSLWSTILAGLCVALSPLTQFLHGVGIVDHHYAEYILVLMTLAAGLHWFADLKVARRAAAMGVILGLAPGIHNGLFILQIPVLATLVLLWLQGAQLQQRGALCFGGALLTSTVAILIPSMPFRLGHFEYFTLSWFHLYVACGTAIVAMITTLSPQSMRSKLILAGAGLLLMTPLVHQIAAVQPFLTGTGLRLSDIYEMRSLRRQIEDANGFRVVSGVYSMFVWLLPFTLALCVYKGWQERRSGRLFFWLSCAGGLLLLTAQYRLQYFGSFALYLPWIVVVQDVVARWPERRKLIMLSATLCFSLLYYFPLRYQLAAPWLAANDSAFSTLRPILDTLRQHCKKDPGVVFADNDAGHYIRYYTDCSVIANNFLLTKQHFDKIEDMDRLMSLRASEFLGAAPYVDYVLIRPVNIVRLDSDKFTYISYSPKSSKLVVDLLLEPVQDIDRRFAILDEVALPDSNNIPYARLFRIDREASRIAVE